MLDEFLYGTEIQNLPGMVYEVQIGRKYNEMQCFWALIHCGTTSIIIAMRILKLLRILQWMAHIATFSLKEDVM